MDWKRLTASALMLGLLALPASAASITPQTTMKEIRDDSDIRASGLYTYTYVWERDCEKLSTSRDDETLAEVVDDTSAEACAAGLNYLAQVFNLPDDDYVKTRLEFGSDSADRDSLMTAEEKEIISANK